MRVAVVAEYYPRPRDPALGVWAHRQALAARAAGAEVRVLVLHRPVPPLSRCARATCARCRAPCASRCTPSSTASPSTTSRSSHRRARAPTAAGVRGPPRRSRSRCAAAPPLPLRPRPRPLRGAGGDAVARRGPARRSWSRSTAATCWPCRARRAAEAVRRALEGAGSCSPTRRAWPSARAGARRAARASCTWAPTSRPSRRQRAARRATLVTVGHLVARKRHADVLRALWLLRDSHPELAGSWSATGPSAPALERLAASWACADRVDFRGALAARPGDRAARAARVFVLPSVDEAFGVAYVEAMAGGVPAIGCRGEQAPRRSPRPAAACGSSRPPSPRRSRPSCARCSTTRHGGPSLARSARDGRRRLHLGGLRRRHGRRVRGGAARMSVSVAMPVRNGGALLGDGARRGRARRSVDQRSWW